MKRYSTSYQFTVDPMSTSDMERVKSLKEFVKNMNAQFPNNEALRVCLKGRLGRNNPNAFKYHKGGERRGYGAHAYQSISLKDASRYDVYVYNV